MVKVKKLFMYNLTSGKFIYNKNIFVNIVGCISFDFRKKKKKKWKDEVKQVWISGGANTGTNTGKKYK